MQMRLCAILDLGTNASVVLEQTCGVSRVIAGLTVQNILLIVTRLITSNDNQQVLKHCFPNKCVGLQYLNFWVIVCILHGWGRQNVMPGLICVCLSTALQDSSD